MSEKVTIWDGQTFTRPAEGWGGIVATSETIDNNPFEDSVTVYLEYIDVQHQGAQPNALDGELFAQVQHEIAAGVWVPLADQFEPYRILDSSPEREIILAPGVNLDAGSDFIRRSAKGSGDIRISWSVGTVPTDIRLTILVSEWAPDVLDSVTVKAYAERYTTN